MTNIITRNVCFILGLALSTVSFGQTQVPNTFEAGQPARAAEVNENFDALEAGIDANSAAITEGDAALTSRLGAVVLDGNGDEIGQLISIGENFWSLIAINQLGYIQSVSFRDGSVGSGALVYESSDCSGTAYAIDTFGGHVQRYFDAFGNPGLYYVEKSAAAISNFSSGSLSFESGCFTQSDSGRTVWPALINDPAVTGVSSGTYSLPIRIDRAE